MAKKSIHLGRLLITGIIWVPVYLQLLLYMLYFASVSFNPLSLEEWHSRASAFIGGEWVVQTGADWLTLLTMILFVPLMLVGWSIVYRIHWKKLIPTCFKEKKVKKKSIQLASVKKIFEPAKLRIQSSALLSVPIGQAAQPDGSALPPVTASSAQQSAAPAAAQAAPQQPKYDDEESVQQMLALTANIKADFFPHVSMDGAYVSFALSTENKAAIVQIINRPDSVWAVDTAVSIEESCWFDQTSCVQPPMKDAMSVAQQLRESEPDSNAVPVILLMSGQLLNVDETLDYYEKNNIMLLRLDAVETPEIPLFMDFVTEFFGLKTTEGGTQ